MVAVRFREVAEETAAIFGVPPAAVIAVTAMAFSFPDNSHKGGRELRELPTVLIL
ncbi:hypothetical protein GMSM_28020 [Geomonas sp. Red276]